MDMYSNLYMEGTMYCVERLQGDEDVENREPAATPQAADRTQQSLAFNDELDDLEYLKMKDAGSLYFFCRCKSLKANDNSERSGKD